MTDYFDALEAELRTAVPRAVHRWWRPSIPRPAAGRLGLAMLVAVPVAVAAVAIVLLGHGSARMLRASPHRGSAASTPAPIRPRTPLRLYGDGVTGLRFGATPGAVRAALSVRFGRAITSRTPENCGTQRQLTWPFVLDPRTGRLERHEEMSAYFDRGRFVGYQFGGADPRVSGRVLVPAAVAQTARGLRIGDSLARGRRLYGHSFRLSNAQGGSWHVRTPRGLLDGFARVRSFPIGPTAHVETIDAGHVGCPAVSP